MRAKIVVTVIIVFVLVFVAIITSQVAAFTGNMPQYCSDGAWCFDFANDVSFNLADSNGTHLRIEGISGWSEDLVVGSSGDINVSSNNKSTIIMYKHNSTYDKFNLSGDGSATVYLSKQADTDFAVYENGSQIDTINSGADGRINFTVTLSENQYVVNTTITNYAPCFNNMTVPVDNDPNINNSYAFNASDQDGLNDTTKITINFSRSDAGCSAPNDALNHYQVVYDVQNQSITGYPGDYFYLTEGVNTSKTDDSFNIKFKPESHARPSKLTSNTTVNDYVWYVNATITDGKSSTWLNGTTEIKPLTLLDYSSTALTLDAKSKGETYNFSNNPVVDNAGNVWHHINFSMTDLTSDSTEDYIGASNCSLDDDASHNETTESGKPEMTYHTHTQTWEVNLTTQRGIDSDVSTYNFIYIPRVEDAKYTGTVTYEGVESHAK